MTTFVHFPIPVETLKLEPGQYFTIQSGSLHWVCLCVVYQDETAALVLHTTKEQESPPFVVPAINLPEWAQRLSGEFTFRPAGKAIPTPHADGWTVPGCLVVVPDGRAFLRTSGRGAFGREYYAVETGQEVARLPEGSAFYVDWELWWQAVDGAARKPEIIASYAKRAG